MFWHVFEDFGVKTRRNKACTALYTWTDQMADDSYMIVVDSPGKYLKTEPACTALSKPLPKQLLTALEH